MRNRFYCPGSLETATAHLAGSEAHHLINVLRMQPGEEVELFDGQGSCAVARIEQTGRRGVDLQILLRNDPEPHSFTQITLATAVPKGDRFRWLIEKATELGVDRLVPLKTARSVVDPGEAKLEKLRATVISACKQCGRSRLMQIDAPMLWDRFVEQHLRGAAAFVGDMSGSPWEAIPASLTEPTVIAVGPEGGWTADELSLARNAGATIVSLGRWILRIETAAVALATLCTAAGETSERNRRTVSRTSTNTGTTVVLGSN